MDETEQVFKAKLRKVGTSFGVLIPNRMIKRNRFKAGEEVEMALIKKQRIDLIEKAFGMAKGAGSFRRENVDRL